MAGVRKEFVKGTKGETDGWVGREERKDWKKKKSVMMRCVDAGSLSVVEKKK